MIREVWRRLVFFFSSICRRKEAIYLSGAIDHAPDRGVGWRQEVKPKLQMAGYSVIDPTEGVDHELGRFLGWDLFSLEAWLELSTGNPRLYRQACRFLRERDERLLARANIVLVRLDEYAGDGTRSEASLGAFLGRDVLVWEAWSGAAPALSVWFTGCVTSFHSDFGSILDVLEARKRC